MLPQIEKITFGCENAKVENMDSGKLGNGASQENIAYVRQMLAELANVARKERTDLLVYLLEMAYTEASDILTARSEAGKIQGHHAAGMAVKPARKV